ncbi:MAG: preprotein translocase subunit SecA [Candidatus Competibacteraceae bacterium]|nr:preprotein translocase subunit SecA [Candidatus Competibacteraceae bacterium]
MGLLGNILSKFVGNKTDRDLKELSPIVEEVKVHFENYQKLSNDDLRKQTYRFKTQIKQAISEIEIKIADLRRNAEDETLDSVAKDDLYKEIDQLEKQVTATIESVLKEIQAEAFALIKETARRFKDMSPIEVTATDFDRDLATRKSHITIKGDKAYWEKTWNAAGGEVSWEMVHYDVQLIGGSVLHQGKIAEMATGEGKTLVATLPVYLNALPGKGVHLVTVNDYLARRDSEWMGVLFEFHGLKVDCIDKHQPNSEERRNAYLADITYGTNNEFGFDYLRDNMCRTPEELVQRGHNFAIVDEVDSVLIDDARTPLIISGPTPKGENQEFIQLKPNVEKLMNAQRRVINTQFADARRFLSADNSSKEEEKKGAEFLFRSYRGLPKNKALIKFLSEPGMRTILQKTENYYLQDQQKEMHVIDDELYFVIDEKNNSVDMTDKGIELITKDAADPSFFIIPDMATGLAAIDQMDAPKEVKVQHKENLIRDFSIKTERIHTIIQLLKAYTLFEIDVDYVVMDGKVKIVDEQTGRILEGRRYSDGLHQAIEAKENVKVEAATQTYATITLQNYFRMYNKLAGMTGTAETEAKEFWDIYKLDVVVIPTNRSIIRKDMNDLVYKTKREKYNAAIDQIDAFVKDGRPVLVGTTSVEISELLSRMLKLKNIKHQVLNAKLHQKEAEIVAEAGKAGTVTIATNMAGRGTDIKLGSGVKDAGGLAIIGTERHDSRRVDRQLRGRAGRQGDPGSSQFYVSLEDDLMRLFGSERIAGMMDRIGLKEGEVITHSMITRSIERAQKKVEENNFGIRKRLLEYDDVMNQQREAVYTRRRHALYGDRLSLDIANTLYDLSDTIVQQSIESRDFSHFEIELLRILSVESPVTEEEFMKLNEQEITEKVFIQAMDSYKLRMQHIAQSAFPVIKNVFEKSAHMYENIVVPITDGKRAMQVVTNLKKAYETECRDLTLSIEKSISLALIDNGWKEHLREMDDLKQSVQNAVYEQKDPLLIYKLEAFNLFKDFTHKINQEIISFLMKASIPMENPNAVKEQQAPVRSNMQNLKTSRTEQSAPQPGMHDTRERQKPQPVVADEKIGRNDPCPCGSGKKYKNCHGQSA